MGAAPSTALGKRSTAAEVVAHFAARAGVAPSELLAGKTALVTGATSGIGVETAAALSSAGCRVLLGVARGPAPSWAAACERGRAAWAERAKAAPPPPAGGSPPHLLGRGALPGLHGHRRGHRRVRRGRRVLPAKDACCVG